MDKDNNRYELTLKIMNLKVGLLELAKTLENISSACKTMGYRKEIGYY